MGVAYFLHGLQRFDEGERSKSCGKKKAIPEHRYESALSSHKG